MGAWGGRDVPYLLVATATALVAVGCGTDEVPRVAPGEQLAARSVPAAKTASVKLPVGILVVSVGSPVAEAGPRATYRDRRAPAGGSFVPITWSLEDDRNTDGLANVTMTRPAREAAVTLVADGGRYPLGSPYDVREGSRPSGGAKDSFFAGVRGKPTDVTLEVDYAGVVQTVDARRGVRRGGPAERLYRSLAAGERSCPEQRPDGAARLSYMVVACDVSSVTLPYTASLGWAKPGRAWAVVELATTFGGDLAWRPDRVVAAVTYRLRTARADFTVDGAEPVETLNEQDDDEGGVRRTVVFDVADGPTPQLRIAERFVGTPDVTDPDEDASAAPRRPVISYDARVPLGG